VGAAVPPAVYEILAKLPASMHSMDRLRTAVSALAGFDPEAYTADPQRERAKAPRLIGQIAQIVANLPRIARGGKASPSMGGARSPRTSCAR
jgi:citrate synthase